MTATWTTYGPYPNWPWPTNAAKDIAIVRLAEYWKCSRDANDGERRSELKDVFRVFHDGGSVHEEA